MKSPALRIDSMLRDRTNIRGYTSGHFNEGLQDLEIKLHLRAVVKTS